MKQFVIRYYNWKVDEILKRECSEEEKTSAIRRMNHALHYCENAMITIDECMRIISEA